MNRKSFPFCVLFPYLVVLCCLSLLFGCTASPQESNLNSSSSGKKKEPNITVSPNVSDSSETLVPTYKAGAYTTITGKEAKQLMDDHSNEIILDVRTQEEFDGGHIEEALLIPYDELETQAPTQLKNKDSLILVYCRSGRRSAIASETLAKLGYSNVYDFGGILDWPYDIVQ